MNKKIAIALLGIIAIAFLIHKLYKKDSDVLREVGIRKEAEVDDMSQGVQSFSISGFSEDGSSLWEIEGDSADILSEIVDMETIHAKYFADDVNVVLTAKKGKLFKDTKDVELRDDVIIKTDEGTTINTDELMWYADSHRITTNKYVEVLRDDAKLVGTGAEAMPQEKRVKVMHDVVMTIMPKEEDVASSETSETFDKSKLASETVISCDGIFEVDYNKNVSYFNDNVMIESKDAKILADKVIAYLDPVKRRIYKAKALGNVRLMHNENESLSDEVVYLVDEGRTILKGRPKVIVNSSGELFDEADEVLN